MTPTFIRIKRSFFNLIAILWSLSIFGGGVFFYLTTSTLVFADIITQSPAQNKIILQSGMEILQYDSSQTEELTETTNFSGGLLSNSNFEFGKDDISLNTSSQIGLEHYGQNPPNTDNGPWWDDDNSVSTDYNWKYRQCFEIDTDLITKSIDHIQALVQLDTKDLISQNKLQTKAQDLRFVYNNILLDHYVAGGLNTDSTNIWLKLDEINPGGNPEICVYYGNPLASDLDNPSSVFSYSDNSAYYYNLAPQLGNAEVISYSHNNHIEYRGQNTNLDAGQNYIFPVKSETIFSNTDPFYVTGPISIGFDQNGTEDLAPSSFAGTEFSYRMTRNTNSFFIQSPFCQADITVENPSQIIATENILQGETIQIDTNNNNTTGLSNNSTVLITSANNCPVLISHVSSLPSNHDNFILHPVDYEWYGVGTNNIEIAAYEDNTSLDIYYSNGSSQSFNLNRGETVRRGGQGTQGTGVSHRVVSNKKIGVNSLADGDGVEMTTFLPVKELSQTYFLPNQAQYLAIATLQNTNTNIQVYLDGRSCGMGSPDISENVVSAPNYPGKLRLTNLPEGSCILADNPIFAMYEKSSTQDETNLWGEKQIVEAFAEKPNINFGSIQNGSWSLEAGNNWTKRIPITIQNNLNTDIQEYIVSVDLSNLNQVFSDAQVDGADLRLAGPLGDGGDNLEYDLSIYDSTINQGYIWTKINNIAGLSAETIYLYFDSGNLASDQSNSLDVFSYTSPKPIYYPLENYLVGLDYKAYSHTTNTVVYNNQTFQLETGQKLSLSNLNNLLTAKGPIISATTADSTETFSPYVFSGTSFIGNTKNGQDKFSFFSPFADSEIQMDYFDGSSWTNIYTSLIYKNQQIDLSLDITNWRTYRIVATKPILANHYTNLGNSQILYPAQNSLESDNKFHLYGRVNRGVLVSSYQNANVQVYLSNGNNYSISLDASNNYLTYIQDLASIQGGGLGLHLVSDVPIAAFSYDDGDGDESTSFLPGKEFSKEFYIPQNTQYLSLVTDQTNVSCQVFDQSGNPTATAGLSNNSPQISTSQVYPIPNTIHIGNSGIADGVAFSSGDKLVCTDPVMAIYEYHNGGLSDERNLFSWPQARKFESNYLTVSQNDFYQEEGLYYPSGRELGNPTASYEYTIDLSSQTYANDITFNSINWAILNQALTSVNGIQNFSVDTYVANSSDCAIDSFSFVETIITATEFDYRYHDKACLKLVINLRTGDTFYTPLIEPLHLSYSIPRLLDEQILDPEILINRSNVSNRRILKLKDPSRITEQANIVSRIESLPTSLDFNSLSIEVQDLVSQTNNLHFTSPPASFPAIGDIPTTINLSTDYAIYINYEYIGIGPKNILYNLMLEFSGSDGSGISREVTIN